MSRRQKTLNDFAIPKTKILPLKRTKNKQVIIIDDSVDISSTTINIDDEEDEQKETIRYQRNTITVLNYGKNLENENKLFISSDSDSENTPFENMDDQETMATTKIEVTVDRSDVKVSLHSSGDSTLSQLASTPSKNDILCPFCQLNLGSLQLCEREQHCDSCLDTGDKKVDIKSDPTLKSYQIRQNAKRLAEITTSQEQDIHDVSDNNDEEENSISIDEEVKPKKKRKVKINRRTPLPQVKILTFKHEDYQIVVDGFNFATDPNIDQYFLSHFHSDHYQGLCQNWDQGKIWCSPITQKLAQYKFKIESDRFEVIANNEVRWVTERISVTAMDANHCPGAQIYLFQEHSVPATEGTVTNPERNKSDDDEAIIYQILHTGDFRVTPKMVEAIHSINGSRLINKIYLDNTYFNPYNIHPTQENVISETSSYIKSLLIENDREDNKTGKNGFNGNGNIIKLITNGLSKKSTGHDNIFRNIILVGSYAIGKEKLAVGIAQTVCDYLNKSSNDGKAIYGREYKNLIYVNDKSMRKFFLPNITHNPQESNVHIVPLRDLKNDKLICRYLKETCQLSWTRCNVIGIIPTGWTFTPGVWNYKQEFTKSDKFNICRGIIRNFDYDEDFDVEDNIGDGIDDGAYGYSSKTEFLDEEQEKKKNNIIERLIKNVVIDETWFQKQKHKGKFKIFKVPYSEHSNFHELIYLLTNKYINYETVIPTVNSTEKETALKDWFQICASIRKTRRSKRKIVEKR